MNPIHITLVRTQHMTTSSCMGSRKPWSLTEWPFTQKERGARFQEGHHTYKSLPPNTKIIGYFNYGKPSFNLYVFAQNFIFAV